MLKATWEHYPLRVEPLPGDVPEFKVLRRFWSPQLQNRRDVLVALPPSYGSSDRSYPVLYMQDGQNLFDPATSYVAHWELGETLSNVARRGHEAIVVGIPNMGRARRYEYSPFRDMIHGGGGGDRYLAFITDTIKPRIDRDFRTMPDRDHTGIGGSSLGGLLSLYALFRHPALFGAAAVISPALWFGDGAVFEWLGGREKSGVIHVDVGSEEGADAVADVRRLRDLLLDKGYREGENLSYEEEEGADHHESAWGRRFASALPFLLRRRETS